MFTTFTYCVVLTTAGLITASPIPAGSGIYQNLFQGDIKLSELQKELFFGPKVNNTLKTGWNHPSFRWPKNAQGYVIVPYNFAANQGFSKHLRATFIY